MTPAAPRSRRPYVLRRVKPHHDFLLRNGKPWMAMFPTPNDGWSWSNHHTQGEALTAALRSLPRAEVAS